MKVKTDYYKSRRNVYDFDPMKLLYKFRGDIFIKLNKLILIKINSNNMDLMINVLKTN